MKHLPKIFLVLSIFISSYAYSQDTLYYNKEKEALEKGSEAHFIGINTISNEGRYVETIFTKDMIRLEETSYNSMNIESRKRDGKSIKWYPNGQVKYEIEYNMGKMNGNCLTYYEDGTLKRNDFYVDDKLKTGECYNSSGKKVAHIPFEQYPEYPGGMANLKKLISAEVRYPRKAVKENIKGDVYVSFTVEKDGRVTNLAVAKSVHPLLDQEALRVLFKMKNWIPGYQDGEPVPVKYQIPIKFYFK